MFDVVMPLFNKEAFVGATIRSVLGQSYGDWRLFVVDDGSSDGGADVVRTFVDPRIILIEQRNQGVGPARNAGIKAGAADWIAFLDADDVWNGDHLAELHALRTEFPSATLIGCAFRRFSGEITPPAESANSPNRRIARYFAECARGRELLVTSSAAVPRRALEEVGQFEDLPGNEDVELWARLALLGSVAVSSRRTTNYRVESGGITDTGAAGRKTAYKPMRREELSSTIPTLDRAFPDITDASLRNDVVAYMDSRIGLRLTTAVLDQDFEYARALRGLYSGKPRGKARLAAGIATLPRSLATAIVLSGGRIKRLLRRG